MNKLFGCLGVLALLLYVQSANATLIGTTVQVDYVNDGNTAGNASTSVVVQAGNADAFQFGFLGLDGFTIDIGDSGILMTCTGGFCNTTPDLGPQHYIFTGLDLGGPLTAMLDPSSNCPLCSVSLNVLSPTSLDVVLANNANPNLNDTLAIDLGSASSVPEPSSLMLLAVGLIGVGFNRRKKLT